MIAAIERVIAGQSAPTLPGVAHWILMSGGSGPGAKLIWLGWPDGGPLPSVVAKAARDPSANGRVRLEYEALLDLHRYLSPGMKRFVPSPAGITEHEGLAVIVESAVRGRELRPYLHGHRRESEEILKRWGSLAEWVTELGCRSARLASPADLRALLFDPIEKALRELDLPAEEKNSLLELGQRARELASWGDLPVVFCHNDLGTPNVTADNAGRFAGIVDWELAGTGLPATDLIYFLGRFAYEARGSGTADELRGFKEIFFAPKGMPTGLAARARRAGLNPGMASEWVRDYCARVGVPLDWLPVLFGVCWLGHALREKRKAANGRVSDTSAGVANSPTISSTHFLDQLRFFLRNRDRLALFERTPGEPGRQG